MKVPHVGSALALAVAVAFFPPILAEELPLPTLYKNLAEKNYYPALEGLRSAQADVKSNILDHLVAAFPDPEGKPVTVKFYWSKPSQDAVPKQKFAFTGPEILSMKAKQRFPITPDEVINAPFYETMRTTDATATNVAGMVTVSGLANDDSNEIALYIDGFNWQVRKLEMDFGDAKAVIEMTSKDLGGKWAVESTVFSAPDYKSVIKYEYTQVEGFWLPSRISIDSGIHFQERDGSKLEPPFVFDFSGWQVNKGIPEGTF